MSGETKKTSAAKHKPAPGTVPGGQITFGVVEVSSRNFSVDVPLQRKEFRQPKFLGAGLPKIVRALSPLPRGTSSGKVS